MTVPRFLGDGYPPVPVVAADPDSAPEQLGGIVPLEVPEPVKDGDGADRAGLPSEESSSSRSSKSEKS